MCSQGDILAVILESVAAVGLTLEESTTEQAQLRCLHKTNVLHFVLFNYKFISYSLL